ncbi:O-methyltransferase [Pseudoduganella umbonata]|uniref:Methyltransferase domain-containing protein n=1 Tax=Pseudoduganella umbonata TaxID=864828 RepID=A0A4P8HW12_9BURK|nr:class I SAM-dependent methyltransferase [Pseudoduganella umbonata]MBB3222966.1 putative O-methyltransferase YrrM [Pseudoduganella umbonata]QCP13082.1 methyltransferase domain-containing protein [Pseudoduganella umbonata]
MNADLNLLLEELERFGEANDGGIGRGDPASAQRMLNITRDTGEFLALLVRATRARDILEIGTSNGYSTLWLADAAAADGGKVTTVELHDTKYRMALENFARAGLGDRIDSLNADAGEVLRVAGDAAYDMVFLDSDRTQYLGWWPEIRRVLRPRGLLVVDNAVSHADQIAGFAQTVEADGFTCSLVPVGKGELLATRGAG